MNEPIEVPPPKADSLDRMLQATAGAAAGFNTTEESDSPIKRVGRLERELVKALNSACRVARLHTIDNSVTQGVLREFSNRLAEFFANPENTQLAVVQGNGRMSINGAAIKLKRHGRSWINDWLQFMERMGLGALIFTGKWDHEACTTLLECFQVVGAQSPDRRAQIVNEAADERLRSPAALRVLSPEEAQVLAGEDEEDDLPDTERAVFLYARLIALAEASTAAVRAGRSPDFQVRHLRSTLMKLIESLRAGLFEVRLLALTALPHRRREPFAGHLAHTAILSLAMGRLLGLPRGHLIDLGFSAFYHDLGRGLLGVEAFHANLGRDLDQGDTPALMSVACALRGRGYGSAGLMRLAVAEESSRVVTPRASAAGLRPPHPFSRVVSVAAEFDRRCNGSPWEAPRSPAAVLDDLMVSPAVPSTCARLLRDVLGLRPRGTLLRAADGSVGIVVDGGARRGHRAIVRRLFGPKGIPDSRRALAEVGPDDSPEVLSPETFQLDWVKALLE